MDRFLEGIHKFELAHSRTEGRSCCGWQMMSTSSQSQPEVTNGHQAHAAICKARLELLLSSLKRVNGSHKEIPSNRWKENDASLVFIHL